MYAFGVATELELDQPAWPRPQQSSPNHDPIYAQRQARSRERTWLRILLRGRANSAACGRMDVFPETELTRNIESWWMHHLADATDKQTCAFILLRRHLAAVHCGLWRQAAISHSDAHWVRDLIDTTFEPWRKTWIPNPNTVLPSCDRPYPNTFLYYVYLHNRLWTLSLALPSSISNRDLNTIRGDCFQTAVHCCVVAVRVLQTTGEPLYCMLAPTWAMIAYAAVLALKLFPYGMGRDQGTKSNSWRYWRRLRSS
ncbi:hypothetical protein BBP40_003384 [Aspergillus hancockii]|nr:hypothetical protein BBP40_003384 [Aspergillus hancockii]